MHGYVTTLVCFALVIAAAPLHGKLTIAKQSLRVDVGSAEKLKLSADATDAKWTTADPVIAQVLGNGWVVGIKPGSTTITARTGGESADCRVTVEPVDNKIVNPSALQQFADNRKFEIHGKICYGSELNGKAVAKEDRRFTQSNRVINPKPLAPDAQLEWEVQEGTEIFDGAGALMGVVAPKVTVNGRKVPTSKFNYGMSKVIHGRPCAYAFAVTIIPDDRIRPLMDAQSQRSKTVGTSAWLPLDRVVDQEGLLERLNIGHGKLPRLPLEAARYRITGGDPAAYMTELGELAIVEDVDSGPVPSHYLRRPSGTVNILYSVPGFGLGGQGLDSILLNGDAIFRPARGAKRFVQPTYFPIKHPRAGKVSPKTMTFIYGAVEVQGSETIYGWISLEALTQMR